MSLRILLALTYFACVCCAMFTGQHAAAMTVLVASTALCFAYLVVSGSRSKDRPLFWAGLSGLVCLAVIPSARWQVKWDSSDPRSQWPLLIRVHRDVDRALQQITQRVDGDPLLRVVSPTSRSAEALVHRKRSRLVACAPYLWRQPMSIMTAMSM